MLISDFLRTQLHCPLSWVPGAKATLPPVIIALDEGGNPVALEWTEDKMEIAEEEPSGTAPPVAV